MYNPLKDMLMDMGMDLITPTHPGTCENCGKHRFVTEDDLCTYCFNKLNQE